MAKSKTVKKHPTSEQIIEAAFALIAEKGLAKLRLSTLARTFDMTLAEFRKIIPSVEALFDLFIDHIDAEMLDNVENDGTMSKRDLYFDMLMSRFDSLQMHRDGVVRWLRDLPKYPALWCHTLKRWDQSLSLMLDLANDSPLLPMKKIGFSWIYASSVKAWMDDDTTDLAQTMVAVDRYLEKGGMVVSRFMSPKKAACPPFLPLFQVKRP